MRINAVSIILAVLLLFTVSCGSDSKNKPDIILVVPDALRAKQLPCYGYGKIKTPHIDAVAKEGVLFKNCFVKIPSTLPSFSNIFSGLLFPSDGLVKGEKKLARYLKDNGYITLGVVSSRILWSEEHKEKSGLLNHFSRGFDRYLQDTELEKPPYHRKNEATTKDVLELLETYKNSDKPIFLFVHYMDPHDPYHPSYDKEIEKIDVEVGRIQAKLKKIKRYNNALVIFTSDHGESIGDIKEDHGSPRGHGWYLYDEQVRVPLIFKFPNQAYTGSIGQVVRCYDILPTILDYAGIHYEKKKQDGQSLLPAIEHDKNLDLISYAVGSATRVLPEGSFSVTFSHKDNTSHKDTMYVFIKGKFSSQVQEFYNITLDPRQENNLVRDKKYEPVVNKANMLLHNFIQKHKIRFRRTLNKKAAGSQNNTQVLQTLGYLTAGAPSAVRTIGHVLMEKDLAGIGRLKYSGIIRHPGWGHFPGSDIWPNMNDDRFPIKIINDGENGFYLIGNQKRELFHYRPGQGYQPMNQENPGDLAFDIKNHRLLVLQENNIISLPRPGTAAVLLKKWVNPVLGIHVDAAGNIYVIEDEIIIKVDDKGKMLKRYDFTAASPTLFAVDARENMVIGRGDRIFKYDKSGRVTGSFPAFGESHTITALALDNKNRVWTAAKHSVMIKVFARGGDIITRFKYNFKEDRYNRWKPTPIKQLYFHRDTLYIMDSLEGILAYSISSEQKREQNRVQKR